MLPIVYYGMNGNTQYSMWAGFQQSDEIIQMTDGTLYTNPYYSLPTQVFAPGGSSQGIAFLQPVEYPIYNGGNIMVTYKRDTVTLNGTETILWAKHFSLCDHLGSVAKEFACDGKVKAKNSYTPFGKTITLMDGDVRTKYIGKETDYETSLADHGVRKYDAGIGRFTCPDVLWDTRLCG